MNIYTFPAVKFSVDSRLFSGKYTVAANSLSEAQHLVRLFIMKSNDGDYLYVSDATLDYYSSIEVGSTPRVLKHSISDLRWR
jgi:hypothetical protein